MQTDKFLVITCMHSLEHSINAINTPYVVLKETNRQMSRLKKGV